MDRSSAAMTPEQEWAEKMIEHSTGIRACKKPLVWRGWNTYCVLDEGHEGACESYGEVLRLGCRRP